MTEQAGSSAELGSTLAAVAPLALGVAIVGNDLAIRSANEAFIARTSHGVDDIAGKPLAAFLHAGDPTCNRAVEDALAHGQQFTGTVCWKGPDGARKAELAIMPVTEQGRLLHFLAVLRDRESVGEAEVLLDATTQRLQRLLDHLPAGVVVHGSDSRILSVNARAAELLGVRAEELLGKGPHGWCFLNNDGSVMAIEDYPVCRTLAERRSLSNLVVGVVREPDAAPVWVLCNTYLACDDELHVTEAVVCFTDCTELKRTEQSIHQLVNFDYLTELPNRRMLMDKLQNLTHRNARSGEWGALLFIDLDNFKLLNDTLGHDIGDLLLRQVAGRLRRAVRDTDCVARVGGDEFVIMLDSLGKERDAAAAEAGQVARKLIAACDEVYTLPPRSYRSTPSIGIAMFDGDAQADVVLRQADVAMYQAKESGRNTMRFFDPAMQKVIDRRYALEHDLREGLLRNQFRLYCQPQFDGAGQLAGGEVLLRWRRSDTELVGPAEFIGLAESTGFVLALGRWVLRETCRHLAQWRSHPRLSRVPLAVNVSAQQLRCADFTNEVLDALHAAGADPCQLGLELTESMLAVDIDDVIMKMECLKRDGVRFSVDDFGTGYSSLSYLRRFPLETLKIDRSFVHDIHVDPDAAAIVEVIITLARKLGLKVIAEGVEQEAQRSFLRDEGCDWFQGYLLGRPLAIDEFARVFANA
jgi:diguanylate cyclase (GGDEF)-like protein/PAS domain S-box-containing protein